MGRSIDATALTGNHRNYLQSSYVSENVCFSIKESRAGCPHYQRLGALGKLRDGTEIYTVGNISGKHEVL
jgi:hypothetical protein